jgi:hypothetical protein
MMGISAFTVEGENITAGVDVESHTLESGKVIRGIFVGRADQPGFLPVVDNRLRNQEGDAQTRIKAVTIDLTVPRLVACSDTEEIDESQALVIFRAVQSRNETCYRGDTKRVSEGGWSLHSEGAVPIQLSDEVVGIGTAQFIQVLRKDDVFSVWVSDRKGIRTEFYKWDGTHLLQEQAGNTIPRL